MTRRDPTSISPLYPIDNGRVVESAEEVSGQEKPVVAEEDASRDREDSQGGVEDGDDHGRLGERKPRIGRRPDIPTRQEIEEHLPLHAHYRSWCPHCHAGKSTSKQHRGLEDGEPLGPCVSLEYAFKYGDEKEESTSPMLVAVDKRTGAIWALEVDSKGVDSGAGATWLVDRLNFAGCKGKKVTLMSDQEPSTIALKNAIAVKRESDGLRREPGEAVEV